MADSASEGERDAPVGGSAGDERARVRPPRRARMIGGSAPAVDLAPGNRMQTDSPTPDGDEGPLDSDSDSDSDSDADAEAGTGSRSSLDRRVCWLLFVGVLAAYVAVTRGTFYAYDAQAMFAVTKGIVDHASLRTTGTGFVDSFHLATPYSPYGIGLSILTIPPYLLSKLVGHTDFLVSMVNPLLMASAVLMVYKTGRALRWSAAHALTAAIGFGLFTQALQATTELFSEPGVTLCVVAIVFGVVRWRGGDRMAPLWIGLAAAAAVQLRPDSLFTVWIGLLAVPLFVPWRAIFERRSILMAGVPMACSALLLVWYTELRYHKVLASYGGRFSTPLGFGLHGLLFDPGKSIFVFDSLTLLGVVGIVALLGRDRPLAGLYLLLIVPRTIFFAKWSSWGGGWSWGPRFLLPCVPLLVLAAVELLRMWDRSSLPGMLTRAVAAILVAGSAAVNYLSIRVPYQQWLQALATPTTLAKVGLPPQTLTQRINGYNRDITTGPLWGDVLLIRHHLAQMGPDWWAHDHAAAGIVLVAASAVCLTIASLLVWGATPGDARPSEAGAGDESDSSRIDESDSFASGQSP